jgi:large subunit ribosomal protein L25
MTNTVAAELRQETGKGIARKLRASGKIPANIISGAASTPITIDPAPLLEIFRKSKNRNTLITLDLGAEQVTTLVKDAQRHPVNRSVLHVDFFRVSDASPVVVKVPVRTVGKAVGTGVGGRVEILRRDVTVRSLPGNIPEFIDVDVTSLDIGDVTKASGITPPAGVELVYGQDFPVATCAGKKK